MLKNTQHFYVTKWTLIIIIIKSTVMDHTNTKILLSYGLSMLTMLINNVYLIIFIYSLYAVNRSTQTYM